MTPQRMAKHKRWRKAIDDAILQLNKDGYGVMLFRALDSGLPVAMIYRMQGEDTGFVKHFTEVSYEGAVMAAHEYYMKGKRSWTSE